MTEKEIKTVIQEWKKKNPIKFASLEALHYKNQDDTDLYRSIYAKTDGHEALTDLLCQYCREYYPSYTITESGSSNDLTAVKGKFTIYLSLDLHKESIDVIESKELSVFDSECNQKNVSVAFRLSGFQFV